MALLCTGACGGIELPSQLDNCDLTPVKTSGECFVFLKCDYQFTDITDPVEWLAAINLGNIVVTPYGFWGKPIPSQTSFDVACGRKFQTQEGQIFNFESFLVDAATLQDQTFYELLREGVSGYYVIPVTCDGEFLTTDAYAPGIITVLGESPGNPFSWIAPPDYEIVSGENNLFKWAFSLQIPEGGIIKRRYLPGIKEVLK